MTIEGKSNEQRKTLDELEEALGRGDIELDEFFYKKREIEAGELKTALSRGEISREEFLQKSLRTGVEKLAVHGDYIFQEDGTTELRLRPDLDALASLYLMDLAGVRYNAVEFVAKGQSVSGAINIDTGERKGLTVEDDGSIFFDHHGKEKGTATSAAQITYETLVGNGFLKKEEWLDKFTAFVTEVDNLSYPIDEKFFRGSWANTLYGVYKILPIEVVAGFFKKGKDPREPFSLEEASGIKLKTPQGEKKLLDVCNNTGNLVQMSLENIGKAVEKMKNQGMAQETPELGRVVMQTIEKGKKNKIPMGFTAAKALGYDTYVFWSDDYKSFFVSSQIKDLAKLYEKISADIPTAKLIRGTMILSPPSAGAENLTLEKFLASIGLKKYAEGITEQEAQPKKDAESDPFSSYITEELEVRLGEGSLSSEEFTKKREAIKRVVESNNLGEALEEAARQRIFTAEEHMELLEIALGVGRISIKEFLERKAKLAKEASKEPSTAGKEKITGPEATRAVTETVEEVVAKNPFWSKFREKISGKIKPKEIYEAVSKTLQEKIFFGVSLLDHLQNMGWGAAVRTTTRWGLGFLTGGAGYFLAVGAGAASGGFLEGRKAYKKEKTIVGLSEEEFAQKLTEIKEKAGKDLKKRIDIYCEIAKNQENDNWTEEKKRLRTGLEKSLVRRAWIRGALKGAVVGAFGGAVGSALSDVIGHFFVAEKVTKAAEFIKGAKDSAIQTIKESAEDAAGKAYEKSMREGLDSLRKNDFSAAAVKGEGQTQVARRIIRDFIAQNQALGSDLKLDRAQLIYAEDTLRRIFGEAVVQPDQVFSIKGGKIAEVLEQAQNLSEEKLQNIQEKFVSKISETTWQEMTDYSSAVKSGDAVDVIKAEAEKKAAEAMGRAAEEAAQIISQAKNITPEIAEVKDVWFRDKWMKYGLGAAWVTTAASAIVFGYKLGRRGGVRSGTQEEASQTNSAGSEESLSGVNLAPKAGVQEIPGTGTQKEIKTRTVKENTELKNTIIDEIKNKFGVKLLIRSDPSINEDQVYEGLKKLREVLLPDKNLVEKLKDASIGIGGSDAEPEKIKTWLWDHVLIRMDYSKSSEEMRRYLKEATEKAKKL